jgi:hypothetical protein
MADNPLFINGTQQIRVDAIYAGQNPSQFTIDIAAGGTHTINNYALLYYGVQQPEKQELIINSTFSDSPLLKIGYKKTGKNKVYVYAIDVVQNITVAEFNDTYSDYVIGLGIVHAIDDKTGQVIESHMWPLTLLTPPRSREAVLVCMADKYIATKEMVFHRF